MELKEDHTKKDNFRTKKIFGFLPLISLIGIVTGALGGYAYYYFIGCSGGGCAITSNPWLSILWGAALGYLLFDMFARRPGNKEKGESQ